MKMGELRAQADGSFVMQTPQAIQPVTLRCTNAGVVEVEEVAEGHLSTRVLEISVCIAPEVGDASAIFRSSNLERERY